ncbi:MAG: DUF1810 domain-containing protein [Janthinobacterium lividum]
MPNDDPFHLQRFLDAQSSTYSQARAELAAGEKRSHWMWFIFPQIQGLGSSSMAQRYAITDIAEAKVYLAHPVLGERLRECTALVNAVHGRSLDQIFGYPDDLKFHSSVTLFARAAEEGSDFHRALQKYFGGKEDAGTVRQLGARR